MTIPTRIYSSVEFILASIKPINRAERAYKPTIMPLLLCQPSSPVGAAFMRPRAIHCTVQTVSMNLDTTLQSLAPCGESDQDNKRDNRDNNNQYIKHVIPPQEMSGTASPLLYYRDRCSSPYVHPPLPPGVKAPPWETVWEDTPTGEIL